MTSPRVLVTGAGGFIGGALARALRTVGAVGVSRSVSNDPSITWAPPFDLTSRSECARALLGVDTLIHAAGRAHVLRETVADPLTAFRAANVATTEALLEGARAAGVRRFVLLSSIAIFGERATGHLTDDSPVDPTTPYGLSRWEAEQLLCDVGPEIEAAVLRLPMVYGPGMKGNPLRLFDLVARGLPLPLGAITNARSMLFVENLVPIVRGLLDDSLHLRSPVFVADDSPTSTPDLIRLIAQALGSPTRLVPVPLGILRSLAQLGEVVWGAHFPLTPSTLMRLESTLTVDTMPLRRLRGGADLLTTAEGISRTAQWYRAYGQSTRPRA